MGSKRTMIDTFELVRVTNTAGSLDQTLRPTTITHTLTTGPKSDKWLIDFEFATASAAATPIQVPSLPASGNVGWPAWTPVVTPDTGAFTTVSTSNARFFSIGRVVNYSLTITITNKGTAGGGLRFTLPVNAASGAVHIGTGRESAVTGIMLSVTSGTSFGNVLTYLNGSPIDSPRTLNISGTYESAS